LSKFCTADSSAGEGDSTTPKLGKEPDGKTQTATRQAAAIARKSRQFFEGLRREVNKVSAFYDAKVKDVLGHVNAYMDTMIEARVKCEETASLTPPDHTDIENISRTLRATNILYTELLMLENFAVMNYGGVCKILKKHDKNTGMTTQVKYINRVLNIKPFAMMTALKDVIPVIERQVQPLMAAMAQQGEGKMGASASGAQEDSCCDGELTEDTGPSAPPSFNSKEVNVLNLLHSFAREGREITKNTPLNPRQHSPIGAALMAGPIPGSSVSRSSSDARKRKLVSTTTSAGGLKKQTRKKK